MDRYYKRAIQGVGTVVLCTSMAVPVFSSPPFALSPPSANGSHRGSGATPVPLDLRPPAARESPVTRGFPSVAAAWLKDEAPHQVKSMVHLANGGVNSSVRSNDLESESEERYGASLRSGLGQARPTRSMSTTEAFARRFHREGLPVARLWENDSALVSLGLNQKGKAGLWLVQKTH